jgi:hypothetical protein
MLKKLQFSKLDFARLLPNIIALSLIASAALLMAWIGWLTWIDMTQWSKDLGSIFFGSRTGEAISLGVGMTVIHYFLISMSLLAAGVVLFLRNRILAMKPQHAMQMKPQKENTKHQSKNEVSTVKPSVKEENAAAREERFFSGCLHHFGYLSSRPKDSPIPQECILCQRLGDCMVATVYVKKTNE